MNKTPPTPTHKFVRGDGSRIEYEDMTTMPCPVCNTDGAFADRRLAVVIIIDNTVSCECPNCGHDVRMHKDEYEAFWKDGCNYPRAVPR